MKEPPRVDSLCQPVHLCESIRRLSFVVRRSRRSSVVGRRSQGDQQVGQNAIAAGGDFGAGAEAPAQPAPAPGSSKCQLMPRRWARAAPPPTSATPPPSNSAATRPAVVPGSGRREPRQRVEPSHSEDPRFAHRPLLMAHRLRCSRGASRPSQPLAWPPPAARTRTRSRRARRRPCARRRRAPRVRLTRGAQRPSSAPAATRSGGQQRGADPAQA